MPAAGECPNSGNTGLYVTVDGFSLDNSGNGWFVVKFPWGRGWGSSGNMNFVFKSGDNNYTKDKCAFYASAYYLTA